jgi:hypothetical protein
LFNQGQAANESLKQMSETANTARGNVAALSATLKKAKIASAISKIFNVVS